MDVSAFRSPRLDALLFGEAQGRVLISVARENVQKVLDQAKQAGITATQIGEVEEQGLSIRTGQGALQWELTELYDGWWNSIARAMSEPQPAMSVRAEVPAS